jgi:hypothetical protein
MSRARSLACALLLAAALVSPVPAQVDELELLFSRIEQSLVGGNVEAFLALSTLSPGTEAVQTFTDRWFVPKTTRATVHERDRVERGGPDRLQLTLEVLVEAGQQARLATWRLDVDRTPAGWRVTGAITQGVVEGLYHLTLDETTQYRAKNLVIAAEDISIRLDDGDVFVATAGTGATVAVLLGRSRFSSARARWSSPPRLSPSSGRSCCSPANPSCASRSMPPSCG